MTDDRFGRERLLRLSRLERWHFWFLGRRALVDRLLARHGGRSSRSILDLGCGSGLQVETLNRRGHRAVGLDMRAEGLRLLKQSSPDAQVVQADASYLPFRDRSFDAVMLLDVLEHVDDHAVLQEVARVLRPEGLVLISVPVGPWLWSYRDTAAGHHRRYAQRDLVHRLQDAQLRLEEMRYYQCLLFPLLAVARLFGRSGPFFADLEEQRFPGLNAALAWVNLLEVRLGDVVRWPWGSSLVAVCRKE